MVIFQALSFFWNIRGGYPLGGHISPWGWYFLAYYKTRNTGTRNYKTQNTRTLTKHQNTGTTPEHWLNNGTLAEQMEYHRKTEQENTSRTKEQQNNIKKYYQYRTTIYCADNITEFKIKMLF